MLHLISRIIILSFTDGLDMHVFRQKTYGDNCQQHLPQSEYLRSDHIRTFGCTTTKLLFLLLQCLTLLLDMVQLTLVLAIVHLNGCCIIYLHYGRHVSHKSDWDDTCNHRSRSQSGCRSADSMATEHTIQPCYGSLSIVCLSLRFPDLSRLISVPDPSITARIYTPFYDKEIGSKLVCVCVRLSFQNYTCAVPCAYVHVLKCACVFSGVLLPPTHYAPSSVRLIL